MDLPELTREFHPKNRPVYFAYQFTLSSSLRIAHRVARNALETNGITLVVSIVSSCSHVEPLLSELTTLANDPQVFLIMFLTVTQAQYVIVLLPLPKLYGAPLSPFLHTTAQLNIRHTIRHSQRRACQFQRPPAYLSNVEVCYDVQESGRYTVAFSASWSDVDGRC